MKVSLIIILDPINKCQITFQKTVKMIFYLIIILAPLIKYDSFPNGSESNGDNILFHYSIGSNDKIPESFPNFSENNEDYILFYYNIDSNNKISDLFPSDSESNEDDFLHDYNNKSNDEMPDSFPRS